MPVRFLNLLSLLLLCQWPCQAGYNARAWFREDGLPEGHITALAQTRDGYLWVGTPRGLARFDGFEFTLFPSRFRNDSIISLLAASDDSLWIYCDNGDVYRGKQETFTRILPLPEADASSPEVGPRWNWHPNHRFAEDADGNIWFQTSPELLLMFSSTNGLQTNHWPSNDGLFIASDRQHRIWAVSRSRELFRWQENRWWPANPATIFETTTPVLTPGVTDHDLWIADGKGEWWQDGGKWSFINGTNRMDTWPTLNISNSRRSQITCAMEDRNGTLWFGSAWGGLWRMDPATGTLEHVKGRSEFQSFITCLLEDQDGAIWVGTIGEGLQRVTHNIATSHDLPKECADALVNTSYVTKDGTLWLGTDSSGLIAIRPDSTNVFGAAAGLSQLHVCSILEDSQGTLWVGTAGGLFRREGASFVAVPGPTEANTWTLSLLESKDGGLWIGTEQRLLRFQSNRFQVLPMPSTNVSYDIRALAETHDGTLWIATIGQGLLTHKNGTVERVNSATGFKSPDIRSLLATRAGNLWVGSSGDGLFLYQHGQFTRYTSADGLPSDAFTGLIEDDDGNIWGSSNNGIFRLNPASLLAHERKSSPPIPSIHLVDTDGLSTRVCSGSGQPVLSRSPDGTLWFPNMHTIASVKPGKLHPRGTKRIPVVDCVQVDGKTFPLRNTNKLEISSRVSRLQFRFATPIPHRLQHPYYRYQLAGLDTDWSAAQAQSFAAYSKLPPGRYVFKLEYADELGHWQPAPHTVKLMVLPQLWERRLVQIVSATLGFCSLLAGIVFFQRRRHQRKLERLEWQQSVEIERRRIAKDLHDDLGAGLTEIAMLGEIAQRQSSPGGSRTQIQQIKTLSRELIVSLEEVVWSVNPRHDNLTSLADYLARYTERFVAAANMNCRTDIQSSLPQCALSSPMRHQLLRAAKEALTNIAKHSRASMVWFHLQVQNHELLLRISDDGSGMEPQSPAKGNGIQNMQTRLAAVGGHTLHLSRPGGGTIVEFHVPLPATRPH